MNAPTTKTQLATMGMDALDRDRVGQVAVSAVAGGVSFATALEVMEFAKLMAIAGTAVPKHLRNNPGQCLAVTFQAVEWRMSPFAVANKSYEVNDRIAYESQLLHAVVEARASLRQRLNCSYAGEGPTRQCTVHGHFIGDAEPRTYTTPMLKDIRVKNSPLWTADPDQQLFYYASRSWARKWAPDVLLGIYTREELVESPALGREDDPQAGVDLHARLAGGSSTTTEGHQGGKHIDGELASIGTTGTRSEIAPADPEGGAPAKPKRKRKERAPAAEAPPANDDKPPAPAAERKEAAESTQPESPPKEPATANEYEGYATRWIAACTDPEDAWARWEGEDELRLKVKLPIPKRLALRKQIETKFGGGE